ALDEKTVQIVLKEMYSEFSLLEAVVNICIAPKHIWEDIDDIEMEPNLQPIGSGPFLWKQYEVGISLLFEKNENYWGQVPYVDEVLYKYYGEAEAATMALRNGDIDCHGQLSSDMIDVVQADPNIVVEFRWDAPGTNLFYFNHRVKPLDVKEVRKAVCLAIDYEKRIEYVNNGYAVMRSMVPWVPDDYRNDELVWPGIGKTEAERIAEANALLDGLGYAKGPDGIRVADGKRMAYQLLHQSPVSTVRGAEMIRDSLREIGIELTLEIGARRTLSGYVGTGGEEKWHVWDMIVTNIGGNPTLGSIIKRFADDPWTEFSRSTMLGWPHKMTEMPTAEEIAALEPNPIQVLLRQIGRETDFDARYDLMQEMQDLWYEELPLLVLPDTPNIAAYRIDKFTGWNPTFVWEGWGYSTWSKSNTTLTQVRPIEPIEPIE
ncbi:ABC transporter substrate-binding protein, partial [Chloroflexota bacterium]